jgi:ABC-type sugar transport system substrate-binding protein
MIATSDAATTQEGDIIFQLMRDFFDGKPTPYHVYSPVKLLTAENIQLAIPWDPDLYLEQRDQLISSDYHNLKEVTEPRPWSKDLNNYNNILFHK